MRPKLPVSAILLLLAVAGGCTVRPQSAAPPPEVLEAPRGMAVTAAGLSEPFIHDDVEAHCVPPEDWSAEPLKHSGRHAHQVWISPSGNTAYGIIRMRLPLPVGYDMVLWAFMNEMRRTEGEGNLLWRQNDPELPGVRFGAEGGLYHIRTNLLVQGRTAWAVYAGTLREAEVVPDELELAERARERTRVGVER